jgi:hypothetical protein
MNRIGIIPEQPKVGGSTHPRQPGDRLGRIGFPGRIAIFRDTPHALDRWVSGQSLDLSHVGAGPGQRHRDHLDPVLLADLEMAVVTRRGTQKPDRAVLIAPWRGAIARPGQQRIDHRIVHQRQTRIVGDQYLFGRRAEHWREQPADFDQSLRATVIVPAIVAVLGPALLRRGDCRQQWVGKRNLFGRGLAARQIERRGARLDRFVPGPLAIPKFAQRVGRQAHQFAGFGACRAIGLGHSQHPVRIA